MIWLTGAFSAANILVQLSSKSNSHIQRNKIRVIWSVYLMIIIVMSFSVYRLTRITVKQMRWNQ